MDEKPISVKYGERFERNCTAKGNPTPQIEIQDENKKPIENIRIHTIDAATQGNGIGAATITFSWIEYKETDSKTYRCVASNGKGEATSAPLRVTV